LNSQIVNGSPHSTSVLRIHQTCVAQAVSGRACSAERARPLERRTNLTLRRSGQFMPHVAPARPGRLLL